MVFRSLTLAICFSTEEIGIGIKGGGKKEDRRYRDNLIAAMGKQRGQGRDMADGIMARHISGSG